MTRSLLVLLALLLGACSACPTHGPRAVRIDPAFTSAQQQAIAAAVDDWDTYAVLTVAISSWDDTDAVPIVRNDGLVRMAVPGHPEMPVGLLGLTTVWSQHHGDRVQIAGEGTMANGHSVSEFDFYSTAAHELGHLFAMNALGDPGFDGHGHLADPTDLMHNGGKAGDPRREISDDDVRRVTTNVDKVWP